MKNKTELLLKDYIDKGGKIKKIEFGHSAHKFKAVTADEWYFSGGTLVGVTSTKRLKAYTKFLAEKKRGY